MTWRGSDPSHPASKQKTKMGGEGLGPLARGREHVKFGIFEHMDDSGVPLGDQIANRMRLIEAYDRLGFHAYHLAAHHGTPLGLAPSPGLMMAAVAQRTQRL